MAELWVKFGAVEADDLVLVVTVFDDQSQVVQPVHVDVGAVSPEAAKAVTLTGKATIDEVRVAMAAGNAYDQLVRMHEVGVDLPDRIEVETEKLTSTPTCSSTGRTEGSATSASEPIPGADPEPALSPLAGQDD